MWFTCFNPLPSPKRGEIGMVQSPSFPVLGFNPLPSPKRGEISLNGCCSANAWVSIRSPHRSEGRCAIPSLSSSTYSFQSAPLTEARGDVGETRRHAGRCKFQSAPLTEARGDASHCSLRSLQEAVSIRSPHRSEGRSAALALRCGVYKFQSAPLTEARGDGLLSRSSYY